MLVVPVYFSWESVTYRTMYL